MLHTETFDYKNALEFLHKRYNETQQEEYRSTMYLLLELFFEQDWFNRKYALQELKDRVPTWVKEAESMGNEFDLKWTIVTREGGGAWSNYYQPQWTGFFNLVEGLILVHELNESDPGLYYTIVTEHRAKILHQKAQNG